MLTLTQLFFQKLLADANADSVGAYQGVLNDATVRLYKNIVAPDADLELADLELCDFTGYASSAAITWDTPEFSGQTGKWCIMGDLKQFECTGDPLANIIRGYAIVHRDGTTLLAVRPLDAPITVQDGTFLDVVPRVGLALDASIPDGDIAGF